MEDIYSCFGKDSSDTFRYGTCEHATMMGIESWAYAVNKVLYSIAEPIPSSSRARCQLIATITRMPAFDFPNMYSITPPNTKLTLTFGNSITPLLNTIV